MSKQKIVNNKPLTKKAFMSLLAKAAQPLPKAESDSKATETKGGHRADGCSGTDKSQGKTEGAQD